MSRKLVVFVCVALSITGCAAQQQHVTCKAPDSPIAAQSADPATVTPEPEHPILEKCRRIARTVTAVHGVESASKSWIPHKRHSPL
jgi:hypothetical protein